jgi:isoleucyl-tRNA synthetase
MSEEFDADFYKKTVFLPKTEFDMRAGLPQKEPIIAEKWIAEDLYGKLRAKKKEGREDWTLHDGPPYANGHIHMGHAVNKVLKDVINRSKQMQGYNANYVPGWDCHGLPIEWKIEEKYREAGQDKDSVDKLQFRQECRDFAQKWVDIQSTEFQRLGVIGDWDNPYLTMTKRGEALIAKEIHNFLLNGGLYKGVKPIMWSVVEKTALAEAEVEYKEHKSITIWIKFPIVKPGDSRLEGAKIVIWTTTPWTMPSNRAVAFGKDIEYAVYTVEETLENSGAEVGEKLVLATSLAESVKEKAGIVSWSASAPFAGEVVADTVCAHPWRGKGYDFDVPALQADFVTDDAGTGFVHIAPGHGADDFMLGMENGIEVTDNVSDDGLFREHVPLFAGLAVYNQDGSIGEGNFAVLKEMKEAGALLAKGSLRHEYPHSWRSKAPLIFRTTPQWFISMETNDLREKALQAISDTRWVPAAGENRIRAMIASRPDWCISRQRAWGVPIAIFVDKKTGEPLRDKDVCERIVAAFENEGSDAWFTRNPQDFLGNDFNAEDYNQVFDIVDVWFESGSTHSFVLEDRDDLSSPADLYLEGSDQHRGWFHSSLLESCGTRGRAPYKDVLTHGFVLDEKGYKMSKSLGNTVAPQEICEEYGADILRLWTVLSDYSEDIRIGKEIIKTTTDLYRRIRNTLRFILGALDGFSLNEAVDLNDADTLAQMPELERLMLHKIHKLKGRLDGYINDYAYGKYMQEIHNFCAVDLSALYFDIRKDRLYCDRPDLLERRMTRTVMANLLESLCTFLAPVLCFTTYEAWEQRPLGYFKDTPNNIHEMDFAAVNDQWQNEALEKKWLEINKIRDVALGALEKARNAKEVRSSLEADLEFHITPQLKELLGGEDLAEICIVSQYSVGVDGVPDDAFTLSNVEGVGVIVRQAAGQKCQRCWKVLPEVGTHPKYSNISLRDAEAVDYYINRAKAA